VHFVYIVRCADGTLYTGYALDPCARAKVHNSGRGARYTAGRLPVSLVYTEAFGSLSAALKREHQLKRWRRESKEALLGFSGIRDAARSAITPEDIMAKEDRGFASMDPNKQREIASKGGRAAHQKGTAHEWTADEAREAGRKGGQASRLRRRSASDDGQEPL
jgi:predicted GIY-YIG superfamily endonuclease/general stress protein YciG